MNSEKFSESLKELGIIPTKNQLDQLDTYFNYLTEYNKNVNLTRIISKEDVYLKHFYDSLTITKYFDINKISTVLDIGTGAGFPGMVLKIFYPHINIYLLDSNNKKLEFLNNLSQKLNISVNLIHERAEEYIKNHREEFDLVVSRAVANLRILSELSIPFVKKNNHFIALKSDITEELKESLSTIEILGGKIENIHEFLLPIENSKRTIVIIKKCANTPLKYPRKYDKIKKEFPKK